MVLVEHLESDASSGFVAGGSSTGGIVDVNQEEVQWTKKQSVDLSRLPSPHGNRASFGVGGGPLPPHLKQTDQHMHTFKGQYFKHHLFCFRIHQKCQMKSWMMIFSEVMMKM